jgi:subtilase family serine protease
MTSETPPATPQESEVKAEELEVRRLEAKKALANVKSPWWRRADPLVLAVLAGILTLLGNTAVTLLNNQNSLAQEKKKAADDLALEQAKARYNLVLQAMSTNDAAVANRNIHFFIDAGLLQDSDCRIRDAIDRDQPVLPSLSGVAPASAGGLHSPPEIAVAYNFPPGDGRGVTIGILEFGGGVISTDLEVYFRSLKLPVPDISSIYVAGAKPETDSEAAYQVMMDLEIIGALAPRARIRVYFAPATDRLGFVHTIDRAVSDGVQIISATWGSVETWWKDEEIRHMEAALEGAARRNVTVVAPTGDEGVTDGVMDGRRHVVFPASSEWVLAVGGTALKTENGRVISETVWNDADNTHASGGGISDKIDRPPWQSALPMPSRHDGRPGRGIPDVVASADPQLGVPLFVHGKYVVFGGTSESVPVWVGLIARIDQALGYSIGYLNPRLYKSIGPEGLLRTITSGSNGVDGVSGYSAGPGWTPVAGWGSPDGVKLLRWLQEHPTAGPQLATAACRPESNHDQLAAKAGSMADQRIPATSLAATPWR